MKAMRMHRTNEALHADNVPTPSLEHNEVLVKVRASGICHSDLNYRNGIASVGRLPITLGHEIAGTVENKVEGATQVDINDRVAVHYVLSCGKCGFCRSGQETYCAEYRMIGKDADGGFAEYVKVPAPNVIRIPKSLAFDQAAIIGCAVSTAYHALHRGRATPQSSLLVYGVGGVGAHAIRLASTVFKMRKIIAIDIADAKLELAKKFGATSVVNASRENLAEFVSSVTDGLGSDLILDFVGRSNTIQNSVDCAAKGARIVVVGISPDNLQLSPYSTLIGRENEILGVNDHLKSEMEELVQFASSGTLDLSRSVTHKVSLDDVNRGIEILEKGIGNPLRVVVEQ
jgi:propanol-preferring alcohol dehydrogenase